MFLLALALAQADCADPETATGRRRILLGEPSCDAPEKPKTANRPVTAAEQKLAKAAFDEIAFDGPAARWRWEFARGTIVCGYVNGKNRIGAYTGWAPFIFDLESRSFNTYEDRRWFFDAVCFDKPPT